MRNSEILLPVGNIDMARAAVHNGADAIYVGAPGFNARGRSKDFDLTELNEIIQLCHEYNVRVHIALNILIFENELSTVTQLVADLIALKPDAFIIQDVGLVKIIRAIAPQMRIHASTQMTVTNHEAIALLDDLDIQRFVLGREVSMDEMKIIRANTEKELEVFVHGALCVAYSGQCFTSEGIGGRSANRGQCAQSCRLEYEMLVDEQSHQLKDLTYLVSPKDLCGIGEIDQLKNIGIDSFKIEGRLKSPEYVAQAAQSYRQAVDATKANKETLNLLKNQLSLTYSRGFFSGWLHGVNHQELVDGTYSAHRGLHLGQIIERQNKKIVVKTAENFKHELTPGMGVLVAFDDEALNFGAQISEVHRQDQNYILTLWDAPEMARLVKLKDLKPQLFINSDPKLDRQLQQSFNVREKLKKIPTSIAVRIKPEQAIEVKLQQEDMAFLYTSQIIPQVAQNQPITADNVKDVFSQLGATAMALAQFECEIEGNLFVPNKILKELKREAVEAFLNYKNELRQVTVDTQQAQALLKSENKTKTTKNTAKLNIMLRERAQVLNLIEILQELPQLRASLNYVILDFEFGRDFTPSVNDLREHGLQVAIATTRILKPKEYHNFKIIEVANPDAVLVRNLGAINYFKNKSFKLLGDFSLNATNHITVDYLLNKGLESLCASYDLNSLQLQEMLEQSDTAKIEINIHQYMPLFHMEHCVFAAFLSNGTSFRDCGKPCEKHKVELKDPYGNTHTLKADQECRNTMFSGAAQSALTLVPQLREMGVANFRLEFLNETKDLMLKKLQAYVTGLTQAHIDEKMIQALNTTEKYGLTEGTLSVKQYKDRKKE
jgi:U32 family peptidase